MTRDRSDAPAAAAAAGLTAAWTNSDGTRARSEGDDTHRAGWIRRRRRTPPQRGEKEPRGNARRTSRNALRCGPPRSAVEEGGKRTGQPGYGAESVLAGLGLLTCPNRRRRRWTARRGIRRSLGDPWPGTALCGGQEARRTRSGRRLPSRTWRRRSSRSGSPIPVELDQPSADDDNHFRALPFRVSRPACFAGGGRHAARQRLLLPVHRGQWHDAAGSQPQGGR